MTDQEWVDLVYKVAIMSAKYNQGCSNDVIADWVRRDLKELGVNTKAKGMSWGVIVNEE